MIPLENADKYNITIDKMEKYGTADQPVFSWYIWKAKHGFYIYYNNTDMSYYFGTVNQHKIFVVTFTVS